MHCRIVTSFQKAYEGLLNVKYRPVKPLDRLLKIPLPPIHDGLEQDRLRVVDQATLGDRQLYPRPFVVPIRTIQMVRVTSISSYR
jgi:hypothetical protein